MWQHRVCRTARLFAATPTGRCLPSRPFSHVALTAPGWRSAGLRRVLLADCNLQRRCLASRGDGQPEKPEGSEPLPPTVGEATEPVAKDADSPAVGSSADVAVGQGKDAALMEQPKKVESIEDILVRTHRKELIQRVGPEVERYLPTEDPTAFLLPDKRLQPEERKWQKVFVFLPWAVFACMLATPFLMVRGNLPWLQKRAEAFRNAQEAREEDEVPAHLPAFEIVNFGQMPDVLERPFPTMLMVFEPSTFASKMFLPVLRDLSEMLRAAGVVVSIAALDLSASPQPPADFLWEYPPALAPHLQLVLPRVQDGEAGVVDYDGSWNVVALANVARGLAGPYGPSVPHEELVRLQSQIERLRDLLFELVFLAGSAASAAPAGQKSGKSSWMGRLLGSGGSDTAAEVRGDTISLEAKVDFSRGVDAAVSSCEEVMRAAQTDAKRPPA